MKVKMAVLQNALPALTELSSKALPAPAAFKVAVVIKALTEPMTIFEETRAKLLKEVGEEDQEKPGNYKIVNAERWQAEMVALLDQEVELAVSPIKVSEMKDISIEPKTLVALDWCLEG